MRGLFRYRIVWLAGIGILAFGLRLAAAGWWEQRLPEGTRFAFGDSEGYWRLGQTLAAGEPYRYGDDRVFRMPGYPLLLAGVFRLVGPEAPTFAGSIATAFAASLAVGGVFWIGRQLFDETTAWAAALGVAVYPELVAMGGLLLSEAPFCGLLPFQFACWIQGWRAEKPRSFAGWLLAAGVWAGIGTMIRPGWLLFTPFAVTLAILFSSERRRHALAGIWLLLGLVAVMLPWWVRNYQVTGRFVLTTLQVGPSLYDGLSPNASGASNMDFVPKLKQQLHDAEARQASPPAGSFEERFDQFTRDQSLAWAKLNSPRVAELAVLKLVRFWNFWPNEPQFRSPLARLAMLATYGPLLILAGVGAWQYARRGWPYVLCLLPAVYLSLLHMVFVSSLRYRQPALLFLILFAAAAAVDFVRRFRTQVPTPS